MSRLKYIEVKELDLKECDLVRLPLNLYRKLANSPDRATDKEIIEVLAVASLATSIGTLSDQKGSFQCESNSKSHPLMTK